MAVVTQGLGSVRILTQGFSEAYANPIQPAPSQRWQDATNRYSLENLFAPSEEPVTLTDMKNHLRVDVDDTADDFEIREMITAAREQAEAICKRCFVSSTWRLSMDMFPRVSDFAPLTFGAEMVPGMIQTRGAYKRDAGEFEIPLSPVQQVLQLSYIDANGVRQILDPLTYAVDTLGYPATITPAYSTAWPSIQQGQYGVQVIFIAGYGQGAACPASVRRWIKLRAGTMYRNREEVALFRGTIQELSFVDRLLDPYRLYEV